MDTTLIQEGMMNKALGATRAISQQINRGVLPVDLRRIAQCFGYSIEEGAIEQQGYITTTRDGQRVIRVRQGDSERVKRFTLAHEIGHIIWRQCVTVTPTSTRVFRAQNRSYEERIADYLAVELLMPISLFQEALRTYSLPSQDALRAMARIFGVSLTACIRRITELPRCVAFTYMYDISSESREMTVRFKGGYPRRNKLTFVDAPSSLVRECLRYASATGRLWRGHVNVRIDDACLQLPAFSEVAVGPRLSTVRVSGWILTKTMDSAQPIVEV